MSKSKIISFDPASLRNIGWSILSFTEDSQGKCVNVECKAGTIVIPKVHEHWHALWPMFVSVDKFVENEDPDLIVVEQTSSFSGGFVTGQVSQCMGVIFAVCGKYEMDVALVYPSTVKKKVVGHGRAKKAQVKKAVQKIITDLTGSEISFTSEHAADATANILCWLIDQKAIEVANDGK